MNDHFKPGQKVKCIEGNSEIVRGRVYTVKWVQPTNGKPKDDMVYLEGVDQGVYAWRLTHAERKKELVASHLEHYRTHFVISAATDKELKELVQWLLSDEEFD